MIAPMLWRKFKQVLVEIVGIWAFAFSRLAILFGAFMALQCLVKREWEDAGIAVLISGIVWIAGRKLPGSFRDFCYGILAMFAGAIVFLGVTLFVVSILGPLPEGVPLGPGIDERNLLGTVLGFAAWLTVMLVAIRRKGLGTHF